MVATGGTSGVVYALTDQRSGEELTKVNTFAHIDYLPQKNVWQTTKSQWRRNTIPLVTPINGRGGYEKLNQMANDTQSEAMD